MVRGNWQRRIERAEARRKAEKERKEQRRNKQRSNSLAGEYISDYKASYRRLEEWLDDKGDSIGVSYKDDDDDNRNGGGDISCITVDIWTDARPHTRSEYYAPTNSLNDDINVFHDVDSDDDDGGGRKGRFKGKKKERGHRGGFNKKAKGGKAHPNTKNKQENETSIGRDRSGSLSQQQQHNNVKDERLCAQEFYFGKEKCKGTKKLKQQKGRRGRSDSFGGDVDHGGCSFQHYHQLPKAKPKQKGALTLNQVLSEKFQPHHIRHQQVDNDDVDIKPMASLPVSAKDYALKSSFSALVDNNDVNDSAPCIDMVYHSRFSVVNKSAILADSDTGSDKSANEDDEQDDGSSSEHDENETTKQSRVNHALQKILDEEKMLPTSIVYITIQGILVYDRNQRGLIFTEKEEDFLLYGNAIELTPEEEEMYLHKNVKNQTGNQPIHIHEQLTHHLLDEILSYCEDAAVSVLPQICRSWRDEVGTRSPILWEMLLNRHSWPSDVNGDNDTRSDVLDQCKKSKEAFISHYTVVRDVRALVNSCIYMSGGGGGSCNANVGSDAALQVFKATKGAPVLSKNRDSQCMVKVWPTSPYSENEKPRALAAYEDLSLRLFEVVQGGSDINSGSSHASINCRQVVCLRATPPSVSQKKDSVAVISIGLDEDSVACFVEESVEEEDGQDNYVHPWMTVISRDDIVCAGNEGMLEDDCIQSHDLRAVILDFILGDGSLHDELQEALHIYLSSYTGDGDTSSVCIVVTPDIIPCGKGNFLFHAFIEVPSTIDDDGCQGHRLFLFSSRFGVIIKSVHLERYREGTTLFASRPFKRRADVSTPSVMCTNILISGPTMPLLFMSVEIDRDVADIIKKSMIDADELAPWSQMCASLTSTHAFYSTDPLQGPVLHIKRIPLSFDEISTSGAYQSIEVGERDKAVRDIFVIRDHYVALIIGERSNHEEEEDEIDGQWFGIGSSLELVVYHIHSRQEMYRSHLPSEALSIDCIGETLAMNVSNLGFVITGENARDVARIETGDESNTISSPPPGKNAKSKKKRLAGSGKKKDGFARGMRIM